MEFEYIVDICWGENDKHQEYLNIMGKKGWELISIKYSNSSDFITYFFKRPFRKSNLLKD